MTPFVKRVYVEGQHVETCFSQELLDECLFFWKAHVDEDQIEVKDAQNILVLYGG